MFVRPMIGKLSGKFWQRHNGQAALLAGDVARIVRRRRCGSSSSRVLLH